MTIILISHNLDLIAQIAEKIILLNQGRTVNYCSKQKFFGDLDKLKEFDLEIPASIELMSKLREKGVDITESFYDLEKLVQDF